MGLLGRDGPRRAVCGLLGAGSVLPRIGVGARRCSVPGVKLCPGVRSGSGTQPVPASSSSAAVAISAFFRWAMRWAASSPFASRTASRMRPLVTRPR